MRALILLLVLCTAACTTRTDVINTVPAPAYVPQYVQTGDVKQIGVQPARSIQQAGKIYAYGKYLFQNDLLLGFHIIDNTNPKLPVKLAFLKVPYSTEIAIRGDFLYTNNFNDLVVFDISNSQSPKLVKRIENVFPVANQDYPPFSNVNFQCPDPRKGAIVKWELQTTADAKCRR